MDLFQHVSPQPGESGPAAGRQQHECGQALAGPERPPGVLRALLRGRAVPGHDLGEAGDELGRGGGQVS